MGNWRNLFRKRMGSKQEVTNPEQAYDLWASSYDVQPHNLVLALDDALFRDMLAGLDIRDKKLLDIGCGTGRHWQLLLDKEPARLSGYDISERMLTLLRQKFPAANVHKTDDHHLEEPPESCDLIISTLALAHMPDALAVLEEWCRVLAPGGDIILTDYHPQALEKGADRTFRHEGKLVTVKNYIYPLESIRAYARQLNLSVIRFAERKIDESVRSWYEQQGASHVFERFKGTPIVYSIHLRK
jgi:ubiquinone/menaquinone biosynthesis C-methylase UbiE